MELAIDRPMAAAGAALEALKSAQNFDAALAAWTDFLIHWQRTVNKCDALGRRNHRAGWKRLPEYIWTDPALAYLRAARNADEHGLDPIGSKEESKLAMLPIGSGYIQGIVLAADGTLNITTEEASPDFNVTVEFRPEGLALHTIKDRQGEHRPPPGGPVVAASYGLEFLRNVFESAR